MKTCAIGICFITAPHLGAVGYSLLRELANGRHQSQWAGHSPAILPGGIMQCANKHMNLFRQNGTPSIKAALLKVVKESHRTKTKHPWRAFRFVATLCCNGSVLHPQHASLQSGVPWFRTTMMRLWTTSTLSTWKHKTAEEETGCMICIVCVS